jgi:hypothetical protein
MLSTRVPRLGARLGVPIVVIVAIAFAAGCAASALVAAPAIYAAASASEEPADTPASELVVYDLLPAFEGPDTTPAPAPVPAPASTAPPEVVQGDPRGAEAMALIAFAWRETLPGWSIAFLPAEAGLRGLTRVDDRRIEIYVRDSDDAASLARVVAHELGHAIDVELNSPADRERWRAVRGVSAAVRWWPGNAVSDFDTLAGDFAEAFATMLTGSVSLSRVATAPGPAELAVLAELSAR